jgi:pyruvate/2-oxoglutarate dehydrogenase complex dihydrolipoamide dehydrogenase (E3) component
MTDRHGPEPVRSWLRAAERATPEEQWALLCFVAGREVTIDEDERNGAVRRAELLLATGGDPRRPLELYGRAVSALAADLDAPDRRAALGAGLAGLESHAAGLRGIGEALRLLRANEALAWQAFAMAVLGEALADDDDDGG